MKISIGNKLKNKNLGVVFKIFFNYMQFIGIISSCDFEWPYYARKFFSFQASSGAISTEIFSLECIIKGNKRKLFYLCFINYFIAEKIFLSTKFIFLRTFLGVLLPIIVLFVNFLYWNIEKKRKWLIFTSIIIHIFFHAIVIRELTTVLLCYEIDERKYISVSLDVSCEDDIYRAWVNNLKKKRKKFY